MTPPKNVQRKVWVLHTIDVDRMRADFWQAAMAAPAEAIPSKSNPSG